MKARWLPLVLLVVRSAVAHAEPAVTTLAHDVWGPTALAVDKVYVYFVTLGDGGISRVRRAGGTVEVLASRQVEPIGIAVDESYVYWLARGHWKTGASDGALLRAPKSGGQPQPLAAGLRFPRALAVDGTTIWMLVSHDAGGGIDLVRVAKAGGAPAVVWSGPDAVSFAVGPDAIYLGAEDRVLRRIAKVNGAATVLAKDVMVSRPAVTSSAVFASTADGLVRWPTTGGAPATLAHDHFTCIATTESAVLAGQAATLKLDGDSLKPAGDGRLVSLPAQGGELHVIADHQDPGELVVDGADVFWADGGGHRGAIRTAHVEPH